MTHRNFVTFNPVKHKATVDAHGYVYTAGVCPSFRGKCLRMYISAWASALLVLTGWAMRRPLCVERVTVIGSTLFYLLTNTIKSFGSESAVFIKGENHGNDDFDFREGLLG